MQKGVDPIGIGVIALGVVVLIILVVLSNNMMPQPLSPPSMPDLAGVQRKIEDPMSAAMSAPMGMGQSTMGSIGGPGPMGGPGGGMGRGGRGGEMDAEY